MASKRGQVTAEYLVALLVFSSILIFMVYQVSRSVPEYRLASESNVLNAKAFRISEVMLTTQGYPPGWGSSNVQMVGLALRPHVLNNTKLLEFNRTCAESYDVARKVLGVEGDFAFRFVNSSASFSCGKRPPAGSFKATMERYATLNSAWARITIEVW